MPKEKLIPNKKLFAEELTKWFTNNHRYFPWRETEDSYKLLVAEILLQRTRAENVIPVYEKFLENYPTIRDLRGENVNAIENIIKDLGLQRARAERLNKISIQVVDNYRGVIPLSEKELLSFKGVGPYIARAILCFSGKRDVGIVDKNVARIIERYFDYEMKSSPCSDKDLIKFVQSMVPQGNAKKFNWSMLDFGALVCRPRNPLCEVCVLKNNCSYK